MHMGVDACVYGYKALWILQLHAQTEMHAWYL